MWKLKINFDGLSQDLKEHSDEEALMCANKPKSNNFTTWEIRGFTRLNFLLRQRGHANFELCNYMY